MVVESRRLPEGGLAEGGLGFGRKSFVFGVWVAPVGFKTFQRGGGRSPPPLWMVLKPPGPGQIPKTTDFEPNPEPPSAKPPSGNRRMKSVTFERSWSVSSIGRGPPEAKKRTWRCELRLPEVRVCTSSVSAGRSAPRIHLKCAVLFLADMAGPSCWIYSYLN